MFRAVKIIHLILLNLSISGCYCVKIIKENDGSTHPRWLGSLKTVNHYELCFGNGKPNQVHLFYGQPSEFKKPLVDFYQDGTFTKPSFISLGQIGVRAEHFISLGFIKYKVLALGGQVVYQMDKLKLSNNQDLEHKMGYNSFMYSVSSNLYTLVTKRGLMGYASGQIGYRSTKQSYSGPDPMFEFLDPYQSSLIWRIGYGLQYHLSPSLTIGLEGGYGGGTYARAGISYRF